MTENVSPEMVERIARDHVDAFKAQGRLGGLLDRDEKLLTDLFSQAMFAITLATQGDR
jgi:hypothetical protein